MESQGSCNASSENVRGQATPTNKKGVRPIPSSLLRNTAATAAKSKNNSFTSTRGITPRGATVVKKAPAIKQMLQRQGSLRKPVNSAVKVKKVAASSFISDRGKPESGNGHLPDQHDWDASAIAPRILQGSTCSVSSDCTTLSAKDNCSVLVSSNTEIKAKGLLKKDLRTGNKSCLPIKLLTGGPLRVIHPNNDSTQEEYDYEESEYEEYEYEESEYEEYEYEENKLGKEYLISDLIKLNAKQALDKVSEDCNNEVSDTWTALEKLKAEVIQNQMKNAQLEKTLDFVRGYRKIKETLETVADTFPIDKVDSLAGGLEQCRDHLLIQGVTLNKEVDYQDNFCRILKDNNRPQAVRENTHQMAEEVSHVTESLLSTLELFDKCRVNSHEVDSKVTHLTSLEASKKYNFGDEFKITSFLET